MEFVDSAANCVRCRLLPIDLVRCLMYPQWHSDFAPQELALFWVRSGAF